MIGSSFADSIIGDGSDNVINGKGGSDFINGGGGIDTVVLDGDFADYTITESGGTYTVKTGTDTDIVSDVEKFTIGGVTVNVADGADQSWPVDHLDHRSGDRVDPGDRRKHAATTLVATVAATDPNLDGGSCTTI